MTTIDRCIQDRNWGELARITSETIKAKKARAKKKELIDKAKKQGEEALMYEIDKGRKIKLRKR